MDKLIYFALGIVGALYVKDEDFRKEANKMANDLMNEIKKGVQQ